MTIRYIVKDTIVHGNLDLDGTTQRLETDVVCKSVTIQANPNNVGDVYLGGAGTTASVHGVVLVKGSSLTLDIKNVNLIYVFGTSGDKVSYILER